MVSNTGTLGNSEASVLESFSLRWAVLAAWVQDLKRQGGALDASILRRLEATRMMLASGAFSSCEVGCELGQIEGELVSTGASLPRHDVDGWLAALQQAMTEPLTVRRQPWFHPIQYQWLNCGNRSCNCPA